MTLLLSDIRNFTAMSEDMPPEQLVDLLNEYLSRMTEVVFQFGGTLDKFIGDAILAVFGSPVTHGDDPHRAISTALKMGEVLEKMNEKLTGGGKAPLRIGIALHTGPVVAGKLSCPINRPLGLWQCLRLKLKIESQPHVMLSGAKHLLLFG